MPPPSKRNYGRIGIVRDVSSRKRATPRHGLAQSLTMTTLRVEWSTALKIVGERGKGTGNPTEIPRLKTLIFATIRFNDKCRY